MPARHRLSGQTTQAARLPTFLLPLPLLQPWPPLRTVLDMTRHSRILMPKEDNMAVPLRLQRTTGTTRPIMPM